MSDLRARADYITELEERLSACHEGARIRAEVAVAKERQRIMNELSQMKIDPALLIDIQVRVHYPTQGEVES